MDTNVPVDNSAIMIDGLKQSDPTEGTAVVSNAEPTTSPKKAKSPAKKTAPPKTGVAAQNSCARKAPEKYVPSMKGKKYAIILTQIILLLQGSEDALCMTQRSVKLMGKGLHRCEDSIGMVMAQVSMKATLKKLGKVAEQAIIINMKQLHWQNIRSAKQDDNYGASNIVLPCPGSYVIFHLVKDDIITLKSSI
jgi:hypothetical protein